MSREALREAAAGGGPTTRVVTGLTRSPRVGEELYGAVGESAEQVARAALQTHGGGRIFAADIPTRLIVLIEDAGLLQRGTVIIHGSRTIGSEIRFSSLVSEYIVPFFR